LVKWGEKGKGKNVKKTNTSATYATAYVALVFVFLTVMGALQMSR